MPLKVLHLSSAKTWRGGEQQIAYLFQELVQSGIEQWIACPEKSALADYCQNQGIPSFFYKKGFSLNPIPAYQIARFCKKNKIDILHLHDSHAHTFGVLSAALFSNPSPMVLSRRVTTPIGKSLMSAWKYNHSNIKKIICISEAIKTVARKGINDVSKLEVAYSGIDLSKFKYPNKGLLRQEYHIPDNLAIVGKVAAIGHLKDYVTFVKTARILLEKGMKAKFLIIGGDGGAESAIKNFVKKQDLEDSIIFTGFRSDIPEILPELDVLLFTSKCEGLGTSVLDAMACQVPVVATKAGGIPEVIEHGHSGFLAEIGDTDNLALYVEKILLEPQLKSQIISNANRRVSFFTKREMAQKNLSIYQDIIEKDVL